MNKSFEVFVLAAAAASGLASANAEAKQQAAMFQGLGFLAGGDESQPTSVSSDGALAVGYSDSNSNNNRRAVIWDAAAGTITPLGVLPGGNQSTAYSISGDGTVVVGESSGTNNEAFRWTATTGMVGLGTLPGFLYSRAHATNSDGSVVVGFSYQSSMPEHFGDAFRWTASAGMVDLGSLPGAYFNYATAVSDDGMVVAGFSLILPNMHSFVWTQATGLIDIGHLAGGADITAYAISGDGTVIVGRGTTATSDHAFKWSQATGIVDLGTLAGGTTSIANAANRDGSVIVGSSTRFDPSIGYVQDATRWTALGIEGIAAALSQQGVNLGSWKLAVANDVSADGSVIVGNGQEGTSGITQGWWAVLPVPSNGCINSQGSNGKGPCSPGKSPAFISANVLGTSLQSMVDVPQLALQSVGMDLSAALNTGLYATCDDAEGHLCLLGGQSGFADFDLTSSSEAAAVYNLSNGIRIGSRLNYVTQTNYNGVFDGKTDEEKLSMAVFGAWQSETGFSLYSAAVANNFKLDVARGYLNGIDEVRSEGERDGRAFATTVGAGWSFDLSGVSITPSARYEYTRLMLDSYAEEGGPFPAEFYAVDETLQVTRVGIEGRAQLADGLRLDIDAQWLHRLEGGVPDVTGRLMMFQSGFELAGADMRDDWAEARLGLIYRTPMMNLRASVGASSAYRDPTVSANVGFSLKY